MALTVKVTLEACDVETTCLCSLPVPPLCDALLPKRETACRRAGHEPLPEEPREPWLRLAVLWLACLVCSGLVPGMSVFIELFAQAGVFGSVCGTADACDEQYMWLSGVFNTASSVTLFALLPIGLVFDCHGARACAVGGAGIVCLGLLLLQVPVLGAQAGCDQWTSWVFPLGVMVTDAGAFLNSQCMLGAVWHFPKRQSFVISLSNSSYQAASMLPMALQLLMRCLGLSLAAALGLFTGAVALAACACQVCTPTQAEFFAEARRVLGIPLPPPPQGFDCCGVLRRGNTVIWRRFDDHRWAIFVSSLGLAYGMLYQSLSGDYGSKLFGSQEDGERLAQLYAMMNAVVGGAIAPLGIIFIDRLGIMSLMLSLVVLNAGAFALIACPSWPAQAGACFCALGYMAVYLTLITKYVLLFSPPNRIGAVQGILTAYAALWNAPIVLLFQCWMHALPDSAERFCLPLSVAAGLGLFGAAAFALRFQLVGFPDMPELLPEDELELAKPFGCRDLDEVCYVTRTSDRRGLLRALAVGDVEAVRALVARVDADRVAEKMAGMGVEELAELVEAEELEAEEPEEDEPEVEEPEPPARGGPTGGGEGEPLLAGEAGDDAPAPDPAFDASGGGSGRDGGRAPERLRAESERIMGLIRAGEKEAVKEAFLSVSVDDLWSAIVDMEERLGREQSKALERDFDRLVPRRDFAALLRQRPELKTVVARLAKRHVRRMLGRGRR